MNLREYLYKNRIKQVTAAKEMKMIPGTLNNIISGRVGCSEKMAEKISQWTKGKVTMRSLMKMRIEKPKCELCGRTIRK